MDTSYIPLIYLNTLVFPGQLFTSNLSLPSGRGPLAPQSSLMFIFGILLFEHLGKRLQSLEVLVLQGQSSSDTATNLPKVHKEYSEC